MKTKNFLSLVIVSILLGIVFTSCEKDPITPGNYTNSRPKQDTLHWQNQYNNGGTLPNWNSGSPTINELIGTSWILTKVISGFASSTPNDTIKFVDNTNYTINSGAVKPYQLTASVASTNKTLSLYYFYPFGGSHYSGEVGETFVVDGVINMCEFKNIQNTTTTIKAWFIKR